VLVEPPAGAPPIPPTALVPPIVVEPPAEVIPPVESAPPLEAPAVAAAPPTEVRPPAEFEPPFIAVPPAVLPAWVVPPLEPPRPSIPPLLPSFDEFALEQLNTAVVVSQIPKRQNRLTTGRDLSYMGLTTLSNTDLFRKRQTWRYFRVMQDPIQRVVTLTSIVATSGCSNLTKP
jgi:hypothetical protein